MKSVSCLTIFLMQICLLMADDNSARRYASLDRDSATCKYFLLSEPTVKKDLGLTQPQINSLESAWSSSPTNLPAFVEFHHLNKQLLEAAHTDEERRKIRKDGNEKMQGFFNQLLVNGLEKNLSTNQIKRLGELLLQMKGPYVLLENTKLGQQLNLTPEQTNQLIQASDSYNQFLSLLRHRYLGLQIQTERKMERADIDSEMASVSHVISGVEKDQDAALLAVLNESQRNIWNNLCGKPLSINWKPDYFSSTPFENNKGISK